ARSRTRHGRDFVVAPLEGLWRADDMSAFVRRDKAAWQWTMLIALPDWVTGDDVDAARADARRKKDLPALDQVTVGTLTEGTSVQVLHIGPYDDEGPIIERLHPAGARPGAQRGPSRDLPQRPAPHRGRQ